MASWTSRSGTPASRAAVQKAWRSEWGWILLAIAAPLARRRTMRQAANRSRRSPSRPSRTGPEVRPAAAAMTAR